MGDLIRRQDAQKAIVDTHLDTAGYAGMAIARIPAVDAVLRDEYEALLRRFRHLLKSDFIHSFDEYDPKTGTYKRDIAEADKAEPVRCKDCDMSLDIGEDYLICTGWGFRTVYNGFCHKGEKKDGGKEE